MGYADKMDKEMNSETDRWIIERTTKRKNERKIDRSINRSGQSIAASQDLTKKKVSAKRKSPYV